MYDSCTNGCTSECRGVCRAQAKLLVVRLGYPDSLPGCPDSRLGCPDAPWRTAPQRCPPE
eukprot:5982367-Pyramimonas_sp.AAC.1